MPSRSKRIGRIGPDVGRAFLAILAILACIAAALFDCLSAFILARVRILALIAILGIMLFGICRRIFGTTILLIVCRPQRRAIRLFVNLRLRLNRVFGLGVYGHQYIASGSTFRSVREHCSTKRDKPAAN